MIEFTVGGSTPRERVRIWDKDGRSLITRLVTELRIPELNWAAHCHGTANTGQSRKLFVLREADTNRRNINLEVMPPRGGLRFMVTLHPVGTYLGFEDLVQKVQVAVNVLNSSNRTVQRKAEGKPEEKAVRIGKLVEIRDGLNAVIDFGEKLRNAKAELEKLAGEEEDLERKAETAQAWVRSAVDRYGRIAEHTAAVIAAAREELEYAERDRDLAAAACKEAEEALWLVQETAAELEQKADDERKKLTQDDQLAKILQLLAE